MQTAMDALDLDNLAQYTFEQPRPTVGAIGGAFHQPNIPFQSAHSCYNSHRIPVPSSVTPSNLNYVDTLFNTDFDLGSMFVQDPICEPMNHVQHALAMGTNTRYKSTIPLANAREDLKRPTASDWTRWRNEISKKYKTSTGDMIRKELRKEGFDVT
jgi:hypothetical protein